MKNRNKAIVSALCLLVAFLPGCKKKEEAPPPPPPVAHPSAPKPVPVQKPVSSAHAAAAPGFDFKNRRDPFKPYVAEAPKPVQPAQPAPTAGPTGEQLPIQSYEVEKFKLSGIIAGIKANRALVVDPAGKPYVVQEGMLIGNNGGRITKITASTVEVVERFRDDSGRMRKRTVVLSLAKKR